MDQNTVEHIDVVHHNDDRHSNDASNWLPLIGTAVTLVVGGVSAYVAVENKITSLDLNVNYIKQELQHVQKTIDHNRDTIDDTTRDLNTLSGIISSNEADAMHRYDALKQRIERSK